MSMRATPCLVDVQGLVIRYGGIEAVQGVDLKLHEGEAVAIIGPNGAGKTSLVTAIAGIVRSAAGSISYGDAPARDVLSDVVRHGIALVPEGRNIFGSLTVLENLRLGATIRRDAEVTSDIEAVFADFPILGERRDQPAGRLSGGEQQMLAIARATLSRPRLLILDEPSLGLAPTIVDKVYELLRQIRDRGVALLVVEQNAARAFALADRACVMSRGTFTLTGTPDEISRQESFDAAYFGVAMSTGPGAG